MLFRSVTAPPRARGGWSGTIGGVLGAAGMSAGLALVALHGFFVPGEAVALPLTGLAALAVATVLLRPVSSAPRTASSPSDATS